MAKTKKYTIKTSIALAYRKDAWGIERIVLDSVSNHLPEDSNGSILSVKLKREMLTEDSLIFL